MSQSSFSCSHLLRSRRIDGIAALFLVAVSLSGLWSCSQADSRTLSGSALNNAPAEPEVASISLALQIASAVQLSQVNYEITRGEFHQAGSVNVAQSNGVSVVIGGIPFGTGYVAKLSALSAEPHSLSCDGSAAFDVSASGVTTVPVHVICKEVPSTPPPPPPAVPMSRSAVVALSLLMLGTGMLMLRRVRRARGLSDGLESA